METATFTFSTHCTY